MGGYSQGIKRLYLFAGKPIIDYLLDYYVVSVIDKVTKYNKRGIPKLMAGAYTHLLACDYGKTKRGVLGVKLWQLLNRHSRFLFLGSVSPDLPYLSFKTGHVNWADVMHYEQTNSTFARAFDSLKASWTGRTETDEVKLIWLLGYVSHMVADATIHPVVQATVGP